MGECVKVKNLLLGMGTELLVDISGVQVRFKSMLVGVKPDRYLIIETPKTEGIEANLRAGNDMTVIFICNGIVHGFRASIMRAIESPARVVFITFPDHVETHDLRQSQRVNCYLSAEMNMAEDEIKYDGVILDISRLGCNFTTFAIPRRKSRLLQLGGKVDLTFDLFGLEGKRAISGEIMNLNLDDRTTSLGVRFDAMGDDLEKKIEAYVESVSEYFRG